MWWSLICKVAELPDPKGPFPEPSREQIGDFYVRVGIAVAAWQFVENNLVYTYGRAIRTEDFSSLSASFHTPVNFRVRLDMTDAAIRQCAVAECVAPAWKKLYDRLSRKAKRRNMLAHSVVLFDPKRPSAPDQLFLAPNLANPAKAPAAFARGEVLHQSDLDDLIASFDSLQAEQQEFNNLLSSELDKIKS